MRRFLLVILGFIASEVGATSLQWDPRPPEEAVTAYKVYRQEGNTVALVGAVAAPATTFNVDRYLSGEQTNFVVTADNGREGVPSSKVTVIRCVTWSK
jgi:hypothetical protein